MEECITRFPSNLEKLILTAFSWYAVWSIAAIAVVFFQLPFQYLKYGAGLAALISVALVRLFFPRSTTLDRGISVELKTCYVTKFVLAGVIAIVLAGSIAFIKTGSAAIFLAIISISLAVALLPFKTRSLPISELQMIKPKVMLIAGFVVAIIFYLVAHRPDGDDANFVNLAVGARRFGAPLLAFDTMLGHGPGPIALPTYRVHSFELLVAMVADLLSLPTIFVAHCIVSVVFVVLFVAVIARIGYEAVRHDWIGALFLLLALQLLTGSTLASWGIHGVTRFFQGKAEFVTIVVPLIVYCSYRAVHGGRPLDFLMVALLQIAGVGLTANAIYGAPLTVGLTTVSAAVAQGLNKTTIARFAVINATSIYPMIIGATLLITGNAFPSEVSSTTLSGDQLRFTLGFDVAALSLVMGMSLGWIVVRGMPSGRFWFVYTAICALLLVNPLLWQVYAKVTGNLGFRVFWSVPVLHLMAAVLAILLMQLLPTKPLLRLTLCFCTLPVAALWNQRLPDLVRIDWGWPSLKVDMPNFERAKEIVSLTPSECGVLAPESVATWITTIDNHPYPIAVRSLYLIHYRFTMPPDEIAYRKRLFDVASGAASVSLAADDALIARDRYQIGVLASFTSNPNFEKISDLAQTLGLLRQPRADDNFAIWVGPCRKR